MTWQEELRQLDSALAAGELSANEYRKRRDEILAAASSAQPSSPVIGPPSGPTPVATPEGEDAAEVTQVVNETELVSEADQTQIISDPANQGAGENERTQVVNQTNAAEQTQVLTADERTAPAPQQPIWAARPPDASAFPHQQQPFQPAPAVTPMDAQDLFTGNRPPRGGGKGKSWLIAVAIVVVLAAAAASVWYFGFRNDNATNTAGETTQQTKPAPPPEVDISKIELPGEAVANGGEMDIAKARELKVISEGEATLLEQSGVGPMVYAGTADGDYRFLLYSYESDDAEAAAQLTDEVTKVQQELGLTEAQLDDVPDGVAVTELSNAKAAVVRGLYTYGNTTIQLCVLQVPTGDPGELQAQFQTGLAAVTDAAPPTN